MTFFPVIVSFEKDELCWGILMSGDQTISTPEQFDPLMKIQASPLWRVTIAFPPICAHEFLMQKRERVRIGLQQFFEERSPKAPSDWGRVLSQPLRIYECYRMNDFVYSSQVSLQKLLEVVCNYSDIEICDPWIDPLILLSRAACARHLEQGQYMFLTEKIRSARGSCLITLTVDGNDGTNFCLSPSMIYDGPSFRAGAHFIVRRKIVHPHS